MSRRDIIKFGKKIQAYEKTIKSNERRMNIYRGYIEFIKTSKSKKPESRMKVISVCERMLKEAGYLTLELQDMLEAIFDEEVSRIK